MRKFTILIVLALCCFSGSSQSKLLVTDFIFFNNFDSPHEAYIPDFFREDAERLQSIKDLTSMALGGKYDSLEVSFHEKSTWFVGYQDPSTIDPSERYRDNHKKLVKEGGYDYYLRFYASISSTTITNNSIEYTFSLQVRISDSKGKKVFRNILKAPFSSSFSPSAINSGVLLSIDDFYPFFENGIPKVFTEENTKSELKTLVRPINQNFVEFAFSTKKFVLEKSGSKSSVLKSKNSTVMEIKVSQGSQSESERLALFSDNLELQTTLKVKNSELENDWKAWVAAESKRALGILETGGENATISIRTEKQNSETFELQNGQLTGEIDGKPYLLTYESDGQLMLVYVNLKLKALMQPNGTSSSTLKVFFDGNEPDLPTILNLHQIYKQAVFTLKQVRNRND